MITGSTALAIEWDALEKELAAANHRAANFEVMLMRICYRHDHNKPLEDVIGKAKDMLRQIGKSSSLRGMSSSDDTPPALTSDQHEPGQ